MNFIEKLSYAIFNGYKPEEEEVHEFDHYTLIIRPKRKGERL